MGNVLGNSSTMPKLAESHFGTTSRAFFGSFHDGLLALGSLLGGVSGEPPGPIFSLLWALASLSWAYL